MLGEVGAARAPVRGGVRLWKSSSASKAIVIPWPRSSSVCGAKGDPIEVVGATREYLAFLYIVFSDEVVHVGRERYPTLGAFGFAAIEYWAHQIHVLSFQCPADV